MPYDQTSSIGRDRGFFSNALRWVTRLSGLRVYGALGLEWQDVTPADAGTTTISDGVAGLYCEHSATIAAHTIRLPANPEHRQEVTIASRSIITTLTLNSAGTATVRNGVTTLAAGGFVKYVYRKSDDVWYRAG